MNTSLLVVLVVAGCEGGKIPAPFGAPITGGTLLVTRDGLRAVVSDPDRDRIVTIDLAQNAVTNEVVLTAGDEPGRLIEDGAGRIHVALRRGGSLLTLVNGEIAARRFVCNEPRGLAWDHTADTVHVACAGGELVTFPAAGGDAVRQVKLDRDLRDVIVSGTGLVVTRFRTAELLTLDAQGTVVSRAVPPTVQRFAGLGGGGGGPIGTGSGSSGGPSQSGTVDAIPAVAWRTIALADGRLVMTHQRQLKTVLDAKDDHEGGYGTNCGHGPIESAVTVVTPGQVPVAAMAFARGALPVDIAATTAGDQLAIVVAGSKTVTVTSSASLQTPDQDMCGGGDGSGSGDGSDDDLGTPTSVAFTPSGQLAIFYPEAPALIIRAAQSANISQRISLSGEASHDVGRTTFHTQTKLGIACASCHPEGREDGLVWNFAQFGLRRTQNLAGHLMERAPFHWSEDMPNLSTLMDQVFVLRMAGGAVTATQTQAVGVFLDRIPATPGGAVDPVAAERGKLLFASAGCVGCHNGDLFTNLTLQDVGKGGRFKVPSLLGVGARAPYMHDGSALTLADRFGPAGGDLHGQTAQLNPAQIADLITYLESL